MPKLTKQEWRKHLKQSITDFLSQQQGGLKAKAELQIQQNLMDFLKTQSGVWGGFKSLPHEPEIDALFDSAKKLKWVFSRIKEPSLSWYEPGEKGFERGAMTLFEPVISGAQEIPMQKIQGFLVPGLGFDRSGNRLGHGKGHYDRALAEFTGLKVGVCFNCQLQESLPSEAHDIKMDLVITEKEVIRPKEG